LLGRLLDLLVPGKVPGQPGFVRPLVTILPEGAVLGIKNLHGLLIHKNYRISHLKTFQDPLSHYPIFGLKKASFQKNSQGSETLHMISEGLKEMSGIADIFNEIFSLVSMWR
jgi:hypothetical protein